MKLPSALPYLVLLALPGVAQEQGYTISTFAGAGWPPTPLSAVQASLGRVDGVAVDRNGDVYLGNGAVFKLDAYGTLSGPLYANIPYGGGSGLLAVDGAGYVYFVVTSENRVARTHGATFKVVAGNGSPGYSGDGGPATSAALNSPAGVAVDAAGNVYIADRGNHVVRRVSASGTIATIAGRGSQGYSGDGGPAASAQLGSPTGLALDAAGNLYITDPFYNVVRKVSAAGTITTLAGTGAADYAGDGGPAAAAALNAPMGVTVDMVGNVYVSCGPTATVSGSVRKIFTTGIISTVAGTGTALPGDGGSATKARLSDPRGLAFDSLGNLYIADAGNWRLRRVSTTGIITTVAGNGTFNYSGDGGPAFRAQIYPAGLALDGGGNLYIAEYFNDTVRKVSLDGAITTIAGNGTAGFAGDGGPGANALLGLPRAVTADTAGNL